MRFHAASLSVLALCVALTAPTATSQEIPLENWTVPPYESGGVSTMGESPPVPIAVGFIAYPPCRLVDTRQAGFPTGYGAPALAQGTPRTFDLNSDPLCPGIPAGVTSYSLNVTATNAAGPGFLLLYPQGGAQPTVSTLNYMGGETIANAAIVPAGTLGGITVVAGVSGTDVIVDINGYFTPNYPDNSYFDAWSFTGVPAIVGHSLSTAANAVAIRGIVHSSSAGQDSVAVQGLNNGTGTEGIGVSGSQNGSGWGVLGTTASGIGVYGRSGALIPAGFGRTGVRGESTSASGYGVFGISNGYSAISGYRSTGGAGTGTGADIGFSGSIGLNVLGAIQASGAKNFVEPHPTDPSKVIRYASLEGNEVGTYFRGRSKFQNGVAVIAVPEDFAIVTDSGGLTVQITPIGGLATVGVMRMDLHEIVARSSRDLEFSYLVQGVRRAYRDQPTVIENDRLFVPRSPDDRIPEYLPQVLRDRLISNGTYKPDGSVNLETAHELGWDRIWPERPAPRMSRP